MRRADLGVLFVDELECVSPINQATLLRALDDGCVRPVGDDDMQPEFAGLVAKSAVNATAK